MQRPVFLFSTGWRTGSTLLQRLLCSHPDILVWGENRGVVDRLAQVHQTLEGLQQLSQEHVEHFRESGTMGWIAMMNPPIEKFDEGLRKLFETYFAFPTQQLGRARWGFKEVRHGLGTARFLQRLYPEARFLLLSRHPQDCLASARAPVRGDDPVEGSILAEAGGPLGFLKNWARIAEDFNADWTGIPHLLLRYEHVVEDPDQAIEEIARLLDVAPGEFNRNVFARKERGWEHAPRLTREDRRWLEAPWLWNAAENLGYECRVRETLRGFTRQLLDALVVSVHSRRRED